MNRETARELLVDYINGHLSSDQRSRIEELLERDDKLRLEYESIRREIGILRSAMIADPFEDARLKAMSARVMSESRRRQTGSLSGLPLPLKSYLRAAFVVLLVAVATILFFILHPPTIEEVPGEEVASAPEVIEPYPPDVAAAEEEAAGVGEDEQPRSIRMSFATNDPKVRIYWTFSKDFEPINEGE